MDELFRLTVVRAATSTDAITVSLSLTQRLEIDLTKAESWSGRVAIAEQYLNSAFDPSFPPLIRLTALELYSQLQAFLDTLHANPHTTGGDALRQLSDILLEPPNLSKIDPTYEHLSNTFLALYIVPRRDRPSLLQIAEPLRLIWLLQRIRDVDPILDTPDIIRQALAATIVTPPPGVFGAPSKRVYPVGSYCQEVGMEGSRGVLLHPEPILAHDAVHAPPASKARPVTAATAWRHSAPVAPPRPQRDAGEAAASLVGPGAPGGQRRCARLGRPQRPPGLGRQIVPGPELLTGVGAALHRLGIRPCRGRAAEVPRHLGALAVGRPPERLAALWGRRLEGWRQRGQARGRLRPPAPWPAGLPIPLAPRLPTPPGPLAHGPRAAVGEPAALESEAQGLPGLRALLIPIPEAHAVFWPTGVRPQQDEETMARVLQARRDGHPSDPAIHLVVARPGPRWPREPVLLPPLLEAAQGGGGAPWGLQAQQRLEGLRAIAGGDAREVEPGPAGLLGSGGERAAGAPSATGAPLHCGPAPAAPCPGQPQSLFGRLARGESRFGRWPAAPGYPVGRHTGRRTEPLPPQALGRRGVARPGVSSL